MAYFNSYLDETNVLALFPEALTADVQAILADQTGFVGADAAVRERKYTSAWFFINHHISPFQIVFPRKGCCE